MIDITKPWQVLTIPIEEFLIDMCVLGNSQEMSMVGSLAEPDDTSVRTAHRDIPLPMHRDGIYTQSIADLQGGMYVEKPNVDVVGMYCVRENPFAPCWTMLAEDEANERQITEVNLRTGEALIWDNRLWHGRRGSVGQRLLIRFWTTCPAVAARELVLS